MRALLAALFLWAGSAQADPTPAELQSAKAHFRQGKAFHEIGAFDQAIAEFETAYQLAALPELVFNIARAQQKKGESEKALATYRRYLELDPEGRVADDARRQVAVLTLALQPVVPSAPPPPIVVAVPPAIVVAPPRKSRRTAIAVGVSIGAVVLAGAVVGIAIGVTQQAKGDFSSATLLPAIRGN